MSNTQSEQIKVRLSPEHAEALRRLSVERSEKDGAPVTVSDLVREAIAPLVAKGRRLVAASK